MSGTYDGRRRTRKGFPGPAAGHARTMPVWPLLAVPGTLVILAGVLYLSALAESRFLCPRSLIVSAARTRRTTPEYVEAFVARQYERLLRESQV